ncbi:MAG: hypothetical protein AB8B61_07735, partial [Cyclobacteriaceae bacterium]
MSCIRLCKFINLFGVLSIIALSLFSLEINAQELHYYLQSDVTIIQKSDLLNDPNSVTDVVSDGVIGLNSSMLIFNHDGTELYKYDEFNGVFTIDPNGIGGVLDTTSLIQGSTTTGDLGISGNQLFSIENFNFVYSVLGGGIGDRNEVTSCTFGANTFT